MMRSARGSFGVRFAGAAATLCVLAVLVGCAGTEETLTLEPKTKVAVEPATKTKPETKAEAKPQTKMGAPTEGEGPPSVLSTLEQGKWVSLFDGKTLRGWRVTKEDEFEMHGKVEVKKGAIYTGVGMPFSGLTWTGDFPKENFEVALEAMRTTGVDIFCGTTFPVGKGHVSLICGGWGDTVVGISSVDGMNASENETTKVMSFENDKWYGIRIRVTKAKIEAWIDDKQVIEQVRKGHEFSLYGGVEPLTPFGVFAWQSEGALRNIRFRRLKGDEK